jgi:glycosyltransferase involved in cell wall biosynthesis
VNVLLVTPFRLRGAGVATIVTRLQASLRERGHQAVLLEPGDSEAVAMLPGENHYGVNLRAPYAENATAKSVIGFWLYLPLALIRLWMFLQRQHIDVVHVHFVTPLALYFAVLRMVSRWRIVATFHGKDAHSLPQQPTLYRRLLGLALARVDVVTTVASDLRDTVVRAYPWLHGRSRFIPNGNPALPSAPSASHGPRIGDWPPDYLLAVGSLIPRKGYDVLLAAIAIARDAGYPLDVVVVGGGPEEANLRDLARRLKVEDRVRFVGEIPHSAVSAVYRAAKFFVLASRAEGQPLVVLEAMSCGVAVIATRVNGTPEIIQDGETGLLVEADDAESLAAAMVRLEKDAALRTKLACQGREHVAAHHTWDRFIDRYIDVYRSAIETR